MVDGKVRFALPGDDQLDLAAYLRAVRAAGLDVPITAEVSGQIWGRPDYDPWPVARRCFANLDTPAAAPPEPRLNGTPDHLWRDIVHISPGGVHVIGQRDYRQGQ